MWLIAHSSISEPLNSLPSSEQTAICLKKSFQIIHFRSTESGFFGMDDASNLYFYSGTPKLTFVKNSPSLIQVRLLRFTFFISHIYGRLTIKRPKSRMWLDNRDLQR